MMLSSNNNPNNHNNNNNPSSKPADGITLDDLRKAFSQSIEDDDSDLAEKG